MKSPSFFPSLTVSLYLGKIFLTRTFAILFALVLVLQALDLLSESGRILAVEGNGQAEVLRYIGMRTPEIIARFLPFSTLLGTIIALSTLNQNSEVIALKASGLSAHQVLAPLILAAIGVAALSFAFNDRIVSRATATLDQWQRVDYGPVPIDRGDRSNVWVRDGDNLIQVRQVRGRGDAIQLIGISAYERRGGSLVGMVTATSGRREGNGWRIEGAKRFDITRGTTEDLGTIHVAKGVRPDQFTLSNVDADGMSFGALNDAISDLEAAGRPTKALEGALWHKLSGPLSGWRD